MRISPAEHFAEMPHLRVGQRARGGVVAVGGAAVAGARRGRRSAASPAVTLMRSGLPNTSRTASSKARSLKIQRVRFRRPSTSRSAAVHRDARILHGVGQVRQALPAQVRVQLLARVAGRCAGGRGASALAPKIAAPAGARGLAGAIQSRTARVRLCAPAWSAAGGRLRRPAARGVAGAGRRDRASASSIGSSRPACTRRSSPISR